MTAIPFVYRTDKTLVDGTLRVTLDIEPRHKLEFHKLFSEPGEPGALARLTESAATEALRAAIQVKPAEGYGKQAEALWRSSFFRRLEVWKAIGKDEDYQAWCRRQRCVICGKQDWVSDPGEFRCEYSHVRTAAQAGTGYKPEYMGVPMCHACHARQHQEGYSWIPAETGAQDGLEYLRQKAVRSAQTWAWETLKEQLGYGHWSQVPPEVMFRWAEEHHHAHLLPEEYR